MSACAELTGRQLPRRVTSKSLLVERRLSLWQNAVLTAFASGRSTALVLDIGGGVTSATAVHDGYVLGRPLKRHTLGGDLLNEIALKAISLRKPPPPLHPLYTLKRTQLGPGEYSFAPQAFSNTHPSFHKYMQLQLMRETKECVCRCALTPPTESAPLESSAWE